MNNANTALQSIEDWIIIEAITASSGNKRGYPVDTYNENGSPNSSAMYFGVWLKRKLSFAQHS